MTRFIVVVSGKGGVGKTTTAVNLSTALSQFGKDAILVDGNINNPNVSLHLGSPLVPITLHDALRGTTSIKDAAYAHPSGLKVVPSSISMDDLNAVNPNRLSAVLPELYGTADVVVIDGAAGLGHDTEAAIRASDEAIVVTNPELPSVTDALKTIKLIEKMGKPVSGVVVNKWRGDKYDMSLDAIQRVVERPILGTIPHDTTVRKAMAQKHPVVHSHPKAHVSQHFKKVAAALLGNHYEIEREKQEEESLFTQVLKKLGLR